MHLRRRLHSLFARCSLFLLATMSPALHAATNTVTVCDLAHLQTALSSGGTVNFGCDATIILTNTLTILQNTILDGSGHTITISGNNSVRAFFVNSGVSFTLVNLTVVNGTVKGTNGAAGLPGGDAFGGGLYNNGGTVTLLGVTFAGNSAVGGTNGFNGGAGAVASGGAMFNNNGNLNITNCLFSNNIAIGGSGGTFSFNDGSVGGYSYGGALSSTGGTINLDGSNIGTNSSIGGLAAYDGNKSSTGGNALGGGLYAIAGTVSVRNCSFLGNGAMAQLANGACCGRAGQGKGGGIYQETGVILKLTGTTFATNSATGGSVQYHSSTPGAGCGGALFITGTLNSTNCTFLGNNATSGSYGYPAADAVGGAIYNLGTANVINATILGNYASGGMGSQNFNHALPPGFGKGGGIFNTNFLLLVKSTVAGNSALGGPGLDFVGFPEKAGNSFGGGICNFGTLTGTNDTIYGNSAVGGTGSYGRSPLTPYGPGGDAYGGGIYNSNATVTLTHLTIAGNGAVGGLGVNNVLGAQFGGGINSTNGTVTLRNSIVANSPAGSNCWGNVVDAGGNLSSDASASFAAAGSHTNANPLLGPLGNYGGTTPTTVLLAGSPALNAGTAAFCPPTDQRGIVRPFGGACDIGAFESAPPYSISGQIRGKNIAAGVTVTAGSSSALTDADGRFILNGLNPLTYAVTPSAPAIVVVPPSQSVSVGPDIANINFKAYQLYTITPEPSTNALMQFVFAGLNGQTYELQSSSNLVNWTSFSTNAIQPDGTFGFSISNNLGTGSRFLRTLLH